jgi:hypothetical protein
LASAVAAASAMATIVAIVAATTRVSVVAVNSSSDCAYEVS